MMVVAVVAILFVGPKELPGMLRSFGKGIKKVRAMAGDFQTQFNDALEDADLDGVKDSVNDLRKLDPTKQIKDKLNPLKTSMDDVKKTIEDAADFDPGSIFDDSKGPEVPEPEFADVEAALAKQKKLDAKAAKAPVKKKQTKPAAKAVKKTPVKKKAPSKKAAPKKVAVKKPTKAKRKAGA